MKNKRIINIITIIALTLLAIGILIMTNIELNLTIKTILMIIMLLLIVILLVIGFISYFTVMNFYKRISDEDKNK